jgi:hypothetical protein
VTPARSPEGASPEGASPEGASPEALLRAFYQVVSGPATVPRDWGRLRTLLAPDARLVPIGRDANGEPVVEILTVESYIASRREILAAADFYEREVDCHVDQQDATAHVLSRYETSRTPDGPAMHRGMNSFQCIRERGRWWILHGLWNSYASELR